MALSTFSSISGRVQLRVPSASPLLVRDWVSNAFRRVAERCRWSWLMKEGQFLVPAALTTGTVTVTRNSPTVTGNAAAAATWDASIIGRQFRAGNSNPIYTITAVATVVNPNDTLTIDNVWGGTTSTTATYRIYQVYFTVPSDFHAFVTAVDIANGYRIDHNVGQDYLNLIDPQRSSSGMPYCYSLHDYDTVTAVPLPRIEMWPAQTAQSVYPYLYEVRATDLEDSGATLPRYIRGDLLLEMALADAARWPGPSIEKPNIYYDLRLALQHESKAEVMINEAERQDEEVLMQNLRYQAWQSWPLSNPYMMGDAYWQSHAPSYL